MGVESRKGVDLINGRSLRLPSSHRPLIMAALCRSDSELQLVREPGGLTGYLERHGA